MGFGRRGLLDGEAYLEFAADSQSLLIKRNFSAEKFRLRLFQN